MHTTDCLKCHTTLIHPQVSSLHKRIRFFIASPQSVNICGNATGRGPVQPEKGAYGNAILRFPLDLKDVEDYFIPANGVYLDNVCPCPFQQCLLLAPTQSTGALLEKL